MAITTITRQLTYGLPDDIYHQTQEDGLEASVYYKGPNKRYIWVNSITNKIIDMIDEDTGEGIFTGEIAFPEREAYLVEVDAESSDQNDLLLCALFGGVDPLSIPDIEEDVPGQTEKYIRDKYPIPDHTYEKREIEYSPNAKQWVTPFPFRQPIMTWEEKLVYRDNALMNSDRLYSEDLPDSATTAIQAYRTYLRDITETVGVAWTATIPTAGTGYVVGNKLLVQDPRYKNTTVVDEVTLTVTAVNSDGGITGFSVENKRALYHPAAAAYTDCFFVTNGPGVGASVTLTKIKQVDPWKVQWKTQPLFTLHQPGTARAADDNPDHLVDEKAYGAASKTYTASHPLAVE